MGLSMVLVFTGLLDPPLLNSANSLCDSPSSDSAVLLILTLGR